MDEVVNETKEDDHNSSYKSILLEIILADFAVDLIVFRRKFELSQSELAEMTEIPEELINKIEKGYIWR